MPYVAIITDRDPTLEGSSTIMQFPQTIIRLDAESNARRYAKKFNGFGSVYTVDGESVYEYDGGVE